MREGQIASVINLTLAEVSALIAVQVYSGSPYSNFYPSDIFFIPLLIIPLIFMVRKSNPFSFLHYTLLIFLCTGMLLARSELFYALLDSIYAFGYRDLSQYIYSVFNPFKDVSVFQQILLITWFFVLSQFIWNTVEQGEGKEVLVRWGYIFSVSLAIFLIYPYFTGIAAYYDYPLLFMGVGGVLFLLASAYLLSR
jgi:hypothetical protein